MTAWLRRALIALIVLGVRCYQYCLRPVLPTILPGIRARAESLTRLRQSGWFAQPHRCVLFYRGCVDRPSPFR